MISLYVCPGMYVVENLPLPWYLAKPWARDDHGRFHTDDVRLFASLVKALKREHVEYHAARLSFVPSHIV